MIPALLLSFAVLQDYSPGKVDWIRDPEMGFQKAKIESRAVWLYFTASW